MLVTKTASIIPSVLYHYTCKNHGEPGITTSGKLLPFPQPILGTSLVWLTNMETPDAWALGLTNNFLCCNRTEVRVTVHPLKTANACGVRPWWLYARTVHRALREALEYTGLPMHWWVTDRPVPTVEIEQTANLWARKNKSHA
jgi:hypothetical protein